MEGEVVTERRLKIEEVNSWSEACYKLRSLNLSSKDFVLSDLDGTLRFLPEDARFGRLRTTTVAHGLDLRRPDAVLKEVIDSFLAINAKKAIVTDNTLGGHFVANCINWIADIVGFDYRAGYILLNDIEDIEMFSYDRGFTDFSIIKRLRYMDIVAMTGVKRVLFKIFNIKSEPYPNLYKGSKGRAVSEVYSWINEQSPDQHSVKRQIVVVGNSEMDIIFARNLLTEFEGSENFEVKVILISPE